MFASGNFLSSIFLASSGVGAVILMFLPFTVGFSQTQKR
jgi:hypothetical protein